MVYRFGISCVFLFLCWLSTGPQACLGRQIEPFQPKNLFTAPGQPQLLLLAKKGGDDGGGHRHGRHGDHLTDPLPVKGQDQAGASPGVGVENLDDDSEPPGDSEKQTPVNERPAEENGQNIQSDGRKTYQFKPFLWRDKKGPGQ